MLYRMASNDLASELLQTIEKHYVLRFRQATEENNFGKIVKFGAIAEEEKNHFSRLPEL
jgi:hypothetical protein